MASWKFFPNNLERSGQEFHPLCILLWIRNPPGLILTKIIWDGFLTASTTHEFRFRVGGWLRCMELRRCLDTGPFLHQDHSPLLNHPLQHVGDCHPWLSGTPGCLHKLLLHFCHLCCSGRLADIFFSILGWYQIQGLCEGVTYPSLNPHISRWVPSQERSRFSCSLLWWL